MRTRRTTTRAALVTSPNNLSFAGIRGLSTDASFLLMEKTILSPHRGPIWVVRTSRDFYGSFFPSTSSHSPFPSTHCLTTLLA